MSNRYTINGADSLVYDSEISGDDKNYVLGSIKCCTAFITRWCDKLDQLESVILELEKGKRDYIVISRTNSNNQFTLLRNPLFEISFKKR